MLSGKTILLGVSSSIAAYKAADLASRLKKEHADVVVVMTKNATQFLSPLTFETLTGNRCITDTFDRNFPHEVEHIALAKRADLALIAPASANVIGKIANGIADDMLTTTVMALRCPLLLAPAMNTAMFENGIVQGNIERLRTAGWKIIEPASGLLACGDEGKGRMEEPEVLALHVLHEIAYEKDMTGKRVLVTAGPTREAIDPVRFITNHSTGKMGYALAQDAAMRGALVTLISGPVALSSPLQTERILVTSAAEMADAVKTRFADADIVIKAAAVADMRPSYVSGEKIKKKSMQSEIALEQTEDILSFCGANKRKGQFVCGFAMETEHLIENAKEKLSKKNADMIVANSLRKEGAGFGTDTNIVTFLTGSGVTELPVMSKNAVAHEINSEILRQMGELHAGSVKAN